MKNLMNLAAAALLGISLGAAGTAAAQDVDAERNVRFGVKGGLNLSNIYGSAGDITQNALKPGFQVGLLVRTKLLPLLYLQPELLYTNQGAKLGYTSSVYGNRSGTINLNYVQLPVLLKLAPLPILSIHAGPYAGLLVNANVSNDQISTGANDGDRNLNIDAFNSVDFGGAAGLELNLKVIDIGARYNFGLIKTGRSAEGQRFTGNGYNQNLSVYLAVVL